MATKDKKPAAEPETKVTKITATDDKAKVSKVKTTPEPKEKVEKVRRNFFVALGDYFKGAWYELRQVRWPNRKATWGLTLAVLGFTAFFVVLVLVLDAFFKWIFEIILGS